MPLPSAWQLWRHGRVREGFASSVRITLALVGVMAACLLLDRTAAIIPALLGVIASALAETDDNWRGRLLAQVTTLACFAVVVWAVLLARPYPGWLMLVLVGGAFFLTLLGTVGDRYRAMSTATLIMSIYAAMATAQTHDATPALAAPILLLGGAAWYGLISVLWARVFPMLPVEQNLAQLYDALGRYLELKSRLFEPARDVDLDARRLALALHNGRVVEALNATKESLFSRLDAIGHGTPDAPRAPWLTGALHKFFVAQDLHERASSSHENYDLLADTFFHSDVLFRCEHVLARLAADCLALAEAIRTQEQWARDGSSGRAVADMHAAVAHVQGIALAAPDADQRAQRACRALRALAANLTAMEHELAGVLHDAAYRLPTDTALQDSQPRTLRQFRERLAAQLTLRSPILRHALRLSAALGVGYAQMWLTGDPYGFWILLTIVFVCQPYYGATLKRLAERIGGTVLGLLAGWAVLRLFPAPLAQAACTVAVGVLFFRWRTTRYTHATAAITMLVLLSFNRIGDGFGLIVPRLLDTLAGSLIAGLAVWLVLPSWHSRTLHRLAAAALRAHDRYGAEIMGQYGVSGKDDHLAYRIARRDAHNADAALSSALTAALLEPSYVRGRTAAATRLLVLTHTLLNYLSALGAHRNAHHQTVHDAVAAAAALHAGLTDLAAALVARQPLAAQAHPAETQALAALRQPDAAADAAEPEFHRVLRAQLTLALHLLPTLRTAANDLLA